MIRKNNHLFTINSISELYKLSGLPKPKHPYIGLINFEDTTSPSQEPISLLMNFYSISLKRCVDNKLKYGQNYYDFDEGVLGFMEPGQLLSLEGDNQQPEGWWLVFHPDLIRTYPLGKSIKNYGFFSYAVNEAIHLSETEEAMLETVFKNIEKEYNHSIDPYSQDVMVSQIELLLNYSNRFYNRQFITRKTASSDILAKLEILLDEYFKGDKILHSGLPTVQFFAEQLHLSPNYLSDMLRAITGQSTQQHIHNKLIEKAKEALANTHLSVSEIAYQLGFEHPQSFSKLFKTKMNISPLEYRASFN
ncbi:MAG: helix-turn-helix transcriptional regulator [Bacteroidota bacterium]